VLGELVFEADDPTRRGHRGALVDELTGAGGLAQLAPRIAAMSTLRTLRVDQSRLLQRPQKRLGHAQDLRGGAGGIPVAAAPADNDSADRRPCQPTRSGRARALLTRPDESVSSIARLLGVSRSTLYKYVPELSDGGRAALQQ
jgi:hypothetical protein